MKRIVTPYSRHSQKQKETTMGGEFLLKKAYTAEEKNQAIKRRKGLA